MSCKELKRVCDPVAQVKAMAVRQLLGVLKSEGIRLVDTEAKNRARHFGWKYEEKKYSDALYKALMEQSTVEIDDMLTDGALPVIWHRKDAKGAVEYHVPTRQEIAEARRRVAKKR